MNWLVSFIKTLLTNPVLLSAIGAAVEADPSVPKEERDAFAVIARLGPIYATKQPGWITYQPDGGGPPVQIVHVEP